MKKLFRVLSIVLSFSLLCGISTPLCAAAYDESSSVADLVDTGFGSMGFNRIETQSTSGTALEIMSSDTDVQNMPYETTVGSYGSNGNFLAPIDPPADDSIPISDREELKAIANNLSGKYHLVSNIDLSGDTWTPIGSSDTPFTGVFDGQGHIISGMTIYDVSDKYTNLIEYNDNFYAGLFGYISNASIKNIGLENTNIDITHEKGNADKYQNLFIGGLIGYVANNTEISNCYNNGNISVSYTDDTAHVGGIVGYSFIKSNNNDSFLITDCFNTSNITVNAKSGGSSGSAGGISGGSFNDNQSSNQFPLKIKNCFNTGTISAISENNSGYRSFAGGIASGFTGDIDFCYNTGTVTAISSDLAIAGGIAGEIDGDTAWDNWGEISSCYNTADVTSKTIGQSARAYSGGIVGECLEINLINSYNIGNIFASSGKADGSQLADVSYSFAGGIAGVYFSYETSDSISYCYNAGNISHFVSAESLNYSNLTATGGIAGSYAGQMANSAVLLTTITSNAKNINVAGYGGDGTYYDAVKTNVFSANDIVGAVNDSTQSFSRDDFNSQNVWDTLGFNFNDVWEMPGGGGYPILSMQSRSDTSNPPSITTSSLPNARVDNDYSVQLLASGDTPIDWSITSGSLPQGLNLTGNTISGIPEVTGTFNITVKASNSEGDDSKNLRIIVLATLDYLMNIKFPSSDNEKHYWNRRDGQNNQNGYTLAPCPDHDNYRHTCNAFSPYGEELTWQCYGFTQKLEFDLYGENPANWETITNLNNLKAGDHIRYVTGYYDDGTERLHSIFVLGVNIDGSIVYADCNSSSIEKCIIKWGGTIEKEKIIQYKNGFKWVKSAPYPADQIQGLRSKIVRLKCPVDVEVYNEYGIVVGKVVNNTVDYTLPIETSIAVRVEGDEKIILLPSMGTYTIKAIGNDSGIMNVDITDIDLGTFETDTSKAYNNIVINEGKEITSVIAGDDNVSDVSLFVQDENGNKIAEIQTDGTEVSTIAQYSITATAGIGGTVLGGGTYQSGATVTLTATPDRNYTFNGWYENGEKVINANAEYTFTATINRILEAHFTEDITQTYAITVTSGSGGTVSGGGTFTSGSTVALTATPNSNYSFDGWYEDGVKITGAGANYSFTATVNRTLEARFAYTGSSGNDSGNGSNNGGSTGGGGSGYTSSYTSASLNVTTAAFDKSSPKDIVVTLTPGSYTFRDLKNGNYTLVRNRDYSINGNTYTIKTAYLTALAEGKTTLVFNMSGGSNPSIVITIENSSLTTPDDGSVLPTIDANGVLLNGMETAIKPNSDGSVTVTADDLSGMTAPIMLSIPFANGTNTHVGVLSKSGQNIIIPYSVYKNGAMVMFVSEPGRYGVINNEHSFVDTNGHWASDTIDFITSRGLYSGIGGERFDPAGDMTRAMFVTALSRLDGADLSGYTFSGFTDIDFDSWYGMPVVWAADKGIIGGYGGGLFGPDDLITREQMAVILNNYLKYKGIILEETDGYAPFADEDSISNWAKDAVADIKLYGLVGGIGNNVYAPQNGADRASVAQVFKNLIEASVRQKLQ